jgi:hypothetical protein
MRRLAHAEGVYPGLLTDSSPRLVERSVEPEACFVAECDDATALPRFFFDRWKGLAQPCRLAGQISAREPLARPLD